MTDYETYKQQRETQALKIFFQEMMRAPAPYEDQDEIVLDTFQAMSTSDQVLVLKALTSRM